MTSFLSSFSSTPALSSYTAPAPNLEINVTPSASAYYAGEPFRATISFRNAGPSSHASSSHASAAIRHEPEPRRTLALNRNRDKTRSPPGSPRPLREDPGRAAAQRSAPLLNRGSSNAHLDGGVENAPEGPGVFKRYRQIGRHVPDTPLPGAAMDQAAGHNVNAEAGPSRRYLAQGGTPQWPADQDGTEQESRDGDDQSSRDPRSAEQAQSVQTMRHERRTQSLALGEGVSPQEMVRALGGGPPPSYPSRRPNNTSIPKAHPHSRQLSIAKSPLLSPTLSDSSATGRDSPFARSGRPPLSRMTSASSTSSSITDTHTDTPPVQPSRPTLPARPPPPSQTARNPPPPIHPQSRSTREAQATCTILWAYTRLIATFHPSNHYIPPDPLLPLRSLMLHQPIGSGSLLPSSSKATSSTSSGTGANNSRWQMSFGTGTLPGQSAPSLTGSLVGLASSLLSSGSGGSLEQERKKVWNMKDLPVLETARSLIGVEMKLQEGEKREWEYEMDVPLAMPPSHRGRAWTIEYKMVLSVGVRLGKEERVEEVVSPVRMWSGVSLSTSPPLYNVLDPLIQQKDEAKVKEIRQGPSDLLHTDTTPSSRATMADTISQSSVAEYAQQLLSTSPAHQPPTSVSPARNASPATYRHQRDRTGNGAASLAPWSKGDLLSDNGSIMSARRKARRASIEYGADDLVDGEGQARLGGSAEAVELLSRHSAKSSFDIAKSGELVAVLTLIKTTFRLGETILGVVDINHALSNRHGSGRRVLKMSAYLESHETIPTALLPLSPRGGLSAQPRLVKTHAESHAGYTTFNTRMSFELDVPADATPGYTFRAVPKQEQELPPSRSGQANGRSRRSPVNDVYGETDEPGGLTYSLRLAFLVASPPSEDTLPPGHRHGAGATSVVPNAKDGDNAFNTATDGLTPVVPVLRRTVADDGDKSKMDLVGYDEMVVETVQCEIPVRVLPGVVGEGEGVGVVL